ncbi:PREDICTED: uncharacterized protein LOC108368686 isoform X1 [Rhagoletis zephyria]|uniref:uncharacterized protein LOC108368686 isoform X1 n=1 Tax=Rhagoletis zephyria TaxID=28612 RepID=UPI0008116F23|nr:PREDICTED: uncharacterized protein LOC108368686 isoform X1 [Rhagoletis zephyria]
MYRCISGIFILAAKVKNKISIYISEFVIKNRLKSYSKMDEGNSDIEKPRKKRRVEPEWNLERIKTELSTYEQGVGFAEDYGLLPRSRLCPIHKELMHCTLPGYNKAGNFFCSKGDCKHMSRISRAKGTWFERGRMSFARIYYLMYCFLYRVPQETTIRDDFTNDPYRLSIMTIIRWYSYCREAIIAYQLDHLEHNDKIGGLGKVVLVDESKLGEGKFNRVRNFDENPVIIMVEDKSKDLRIELCTDDEYSLESIIGKHIRDGTTIKIISRQENYEYRVKKQNKSELSEASGKDPLTSAADVYTERRKAQKKIVERLFNQKYHRLPANFAEVIIELMWRQSVKTKQKDLFMALVEAIRYVYHEN